jgi:FkbM family methyltransferase
MQKTVKQQVQEILKQTGFYYRLKASSLYDLYWSLADKSIIEKRRSEEEFYRSLLQGFPEGGLIFDVGANQGSKSAVFLSLGARVVAVEPDEANQAILKKMFLTFRLSPRHVEIVGKALSDRCTKETMWVDEPGSAKNTLSQKWVDALRSDEKRFGHRLRFGQRKEIETTTLDQLFSVFGVPFFIKIDVEGFELSVLKGLSRPVPFLSFEVNLPEFRPEGLQCVELLGRLAPEGKFNYVVDCRDGLRPKKWLSQTEFTNVLRECTEKSVEVLWKSSVLPAS